MNTRKFFRIIVLLVTLGALLIPSTVLAATGEGTGALVAWAHVGKGAIHGSGEIKVSGSGELWILDVAGDSRIVVKGAGFVQQYSSGWVRYAGFDGSAAIQSHEVKVVVQGHGLRLAARGTGEFALRGDGGYRTAGAGWLPLDTLIGLRESTPVAEEETPVSAEYECPEGYHAVVIEVCDVDEDGTESNCEFIYDCVED